MIYVYSHVSTYDHVCMYSHVSTYGHVCKYGHMCKYGRVCRYGHVCKYAHLCGAPSGGATSNWSHPSAADPASSSAVTCRIRQLVFIPALLGS